MSMEYVHKRENTINYVSDINKIFSEGKLPLLDIDGNNILILVQRPGLIETKQIPDPNLEEEEVYHNIVILNYPKRHVRINLNTGFVRVYIDDEIPIKEVHVKEVRIFDFMKDIITKDKDNGLLFLFFNARTNSLFVEYRDRAVVYRFANNNNTSLNS